MGHTHERSNTGRALGVVGAGLASAVTVTVLALHVFSGPGADRASMPVAAPAATTGSTAAPLPTGTTSPDPGWEGGFPGDPDQQAFYLWAGNHRVGSLDLAHLDSDTGVRPIALGYCDLLSERPSGSGRAVITLIRRQTGASKADARELLERSVAAFCPQKARHLV